MNIYIDESGSINNKIGKKPFVIALLHVLDFKQLNKLYKRFVSSNFNTLKELDKDYINSRGVLTKLGNQMFNNGKFCEIKGSQFDTKMKQKFTDFFTKHKYFELFFIKINTELLSDNICKNTARAFNYTLKLGLSYFISHKLLCDEDCTIQLDERNERTEAKYFLENYLNTELTLNGITEKHFSVQYLDSRNNPFIQIADVFANLYYSELNTSAYYNEINMLKDRNILKGIFEFPSSL